MYGYLHSEMNFKFWCIIMERYVENMDQFIYGIGFVHNNGLNMTIDT